MTPYAKLSGFVVCAAGSPSLLRMKLSKAHSIKPFCSLGLWKASGEEVRVLFKAQVSMKPRDQCPPQPPQPGLTVGWSVWATGELGFWAPRPGLSLGRCSWPSPALVREARVTHGTSSNEGSLQTDKKLQEDNRCRCRLTTVTQSLITRSCVP